MRYMCSVQEFPAKIVVAFTILTFLARGVNVSGHPFVYFFLHHALRAVCIHAAKMSFLYALPNLYLRMFVVPSEEPCKYIIDGMSSGVTATKIAHAVGQ